MPYIIHISYKGEIAMKNRIIRHLITTVGLLCCTLCLSVLPVSAAAAEPQSTGIGTTIEPQQAVKRWIYEERDNKLYKRLFNFSTGQWEGDWIFVRDL